MHWRGEASGLRRHSPTRPVSDRVLTGDNMPRATRDQGPGAAPIPRATGKGLTLTAPTAVGGRGAFGAIPCSGRGFRRATL
jgi:hypothetical protein